MPKEAKFSKLAIAQEATFKGTGVSWQLMRGVRQFEWESIHVNRITKVNVWRTPEDPSFGVKSYQGSINFELNITSPLRTLLSSLLEAVSVVGEPVVATYRPERAGMFSSTFKLLAVWDGGPWRLFEGCVLQKIRFQSRPNQLVEATCDYVAARMTRLSSDPGYTITDLGEANVRSADVEIEVDAVAHPGLLDIGVEFRNQRTLVQFARDGEAGRVAPVGQVQVVGDFIEYYGDQGTDFASSFEALTEHRLAITWPGWVGPTAELQVVLPKVVLESTRVPVGGKGDATVNAEFRAVLDSAVDVADEARLISSD